MSMADAASEIEGVPALSLASAADDAQAFSDALGRSFEDYGFAVIVDHGIDAALIAKGWDLTERFFALTEETKHAYHRAELAGSRGYTPFGVEIAKDADKHDLKEFWHIGRDLPAGHRFRDHMADNVWPSEIPEFEPTFKALYAAFDHAGNRLLSAIADYLGLGSDWFAPAVQDGNSVMRLLHYPPIPVDAEGIRAGAHGDINLITLLLGAEEGGLQLLTKSGNWLPVFPPKGALVINVGDMLERLTNNRMPSTIHRVINPPPERRHIPRYSMPFFLHLASDFPIETLPSCIDDAHPNLYPEPITADQFLTQRLREIGLLKS
jgi:isopenicillin N synthase-like dioxygenase